MKTKKILVTLAIVTALAAPFSVYAATSDSSVAKTVRGFFRVDVSQLNDTQKADIDGYTKKMADLQKEFVNKMVENGTMTKEQGDAEIQRIDKALKNGDVNSFLSGTGRKGHDGPGMRGGFGVAGLDPAKLTDQQKADWNTSSKKVVALQKEYIGKMAANGLLTREQGEAATKKIDEMTNNTDNNGLLPGMIMGKGSFGFIGFHGFDTSKLTDQQKVDMEEFSKKMKDLQKEWINKMVTNGAMTKEQGDSAIQRMDDTTRFQQDNGFPQEKGMGRRGFGGKGWNKNNSPSQTKATEPSI
jgi:Protein of unknown function (DUF2680)